MARWLIGLLLVSGSSFAGQGLYSLMSTGNYPLPTEIMQKLEQQHEGVISEFEADIENGELVYEFKIIDAQANTITEYEYRAIDGSLKEREVGRIKKDDSDELAGVLMLQQNGLSLSDMLTLVGKETSGYIVKAEVDNDLGISYIELEILDIEGKRQLAFDIENKQLLPLLKWD
ncbi:PepSY domain-containing protein [Shewanella sp. 125m-7]